MIESRNGLFASGSSRVHRRVRAAMPRPSPRMATRGEGTKPASRPPSRHGLLRRRGGTSPGATVCPESGRGSDSGKRFARNARGVRIPVPERGGAHYYRGGGKRRWKVHMDGQHEWLKVPEVAKVLRIARSRAYELVADGEIPSVRIGRSVRVSRRELERWLEEQRQPGAIRS
jgi:excisionase family DNA binding protein